MNFNNKTIGIWGYGIMGQATAIYLSSQKIKFQIFDSRPIEGPQQEKILNLGGTVADKLTNFFTENDFIIPSGGIDLRPYPEIYPKLLPELDLFYFYFKKPIIAITGTLGKTTVTTLLAESLKNAGKNVALGGNIGIGLCELIEKQDTLDYAVIEVSSFQLEHCKYFAPDLAIWTNFYPNHLDRHTTLDDYFNAKKNIIAFQKPTQKALLPLALKDTCNNQEEACYFSLQETAEKNTYYFKNKIVVFNNNELCDINPSLQAVYQENTLLLIAALSMLGVSPKHCASFEAPLEHRLEKIATYNEITFYNDSKSTVPEATRAALGQLNNQTIILFLGGLSKGVDRKPFIKQLKNKVYKLYCFGKEAELLNSFCQEYGIPASAWPTLDEAFNDCMLTARPGDTILFSPAGASFDLFKNYQDRGSQFKALVSAHIFQKK